MPDIHVKELTTKDRLKQVEEQFKIWESATGKERREKEERETRFITISREYGCAGFRIGDSLAAILNSELKEGKPQWTVFDRKLVDLICSSHKLSRVLVESLDRQRKHVFSDYITGMFTGEPSSIKIFKKSADTIYGLAVRGRVVIIGRASVLITSKLPGGLHVRIVAPLQWRVAQVAAYEKIENLNEAHKHVEKMDADRGRFAQDFLGRSLKDPDIYDLVLNQEKLGIERIVQLILRTMELKSQKAES